MVHRTGPLRSLHPHKRYSPRSTAERDPVANPSTTIVTRTTPSVPTADRIVGAVLGGAVADAVGWPNEAAARNLDAKRTGWSPSTDWAFQQWTRSAGSRYGRHEDPVVAGEYSDDTQLMVAVMRARQHGDDWFRRLRRRRASRLAQLRTRRGQDSQTIRSCVASRPAAMGHPNQGRSLNLQDLFRFGCKRGRDAHLPARSRGTRRRDLRPSRQRCRRPTALSLTGTHEQS